MLAELPVSHLKFTRSAEFASPQSGIGATMSISHGVILVKEVAALSDAKRQGLRPGDRVISVSSPLQGELGSYVNMEVEACDGSIKSLSIRRERAFWPPEQPNFRWSSIVVNQGHSVGYLRINRFDDGAAQMADQAMAELSDSAAMIIDVRSNSGGNMSALRLASYFIDDFERPAFLLAGRSYLEGLGHRLTNIDALSLPRTIGAYTDRAVFEAVDDGNGAAAFYLEDLGSRRFAGPVFLIVGEDTASAAEGFVHLMKERSQSIIIGRPTAGEILSGQDFDLGEGWKLTVPVHGIWNGAAEDIGDRRVEPEYWIPLQRADLCNDADPAVSFAMGIITDQFPPSLEPAENATGR